MFFEEFDTHTFFGERLYQGPEVVQVPGEPVHAVHDESVAVADEAQELLALGAFCVLAGGLVREDPVQLDALQLALRVLVQAPWKSGGILRPENPNVPLPDLAGNGQSFQNEGVPGDGLLRFFPAGEDAH